MRKLAPITVLIAAITLFGVNPKSVHAQYAFSSYDGASLCDEADSEDLSLGSDECCDSKTCVIACGDTTSSTGAATADVCANGCNHFQPTSVVQAGATSIGEETCRSCANPYPYLCDFPSSQNWATMEFVSLWNDGYGIPALVTTSAAGTPRAEAGVLGQPTTSTLLGNESVSDDLMSGFRLQIGRWLGQCGTMSITGSFYFANNGNQSRAYPRDSGTIIARPFFNVDPSVNTSDAELVNYPGAVSGNLVVGSESEMFSGGIGLQKTLCCCGKRDCCEARKASGYIGYRTFWFDEDLEISETLFPSGGLLAPGTQIDVTDRFSTENRFHGVEVGLMRIWQRRRWMFEVQSRIAMGNVQQRVRIKGATTNSVPGVASVTRPLGVLASTSNSGVYERDEFGYLTDTYLGLGYQVSCRFRVNLGYNLMFLNSVARPGRYVDTVVNGTQFDPNVANDGAARPAFRWADSENVFLHGFRIGTEFRF